MASSIHVPDTREEKPTENPSPASTDLPIGSVSKGKITEETPDEDEEVVVGWRTWMAAASGASCVFSGYYTGHLLGNTAPYITKELRDVDTTTWIANESNIGTAVLGRVVGAMADHVGRKYLLMFGFSVACVGSIIMASAPNMTAVLVGAGLQPGLLLNQANFFSIVAELLPRRFRGLGLTMTVSAGAGGTLVCILLLWSVILIILANLRAFVSQVGFMFSARTIANDTGGLSWRSTYIFMACITLLAITLVGIFYRPLRIARDEKWASLGKEIDWVGFLLIVGGLGTFMVGLVLGASGSPKYAWDSAPVLDTLVGGGAGLVLLVSHQVFINKTRRS
jgi:MFS family permease